MSSVFKHNKKRNTAFLYEVLVREGTKATLSKDLKVLSAVKEIIVEYFNPQAPLSEELSLYDSLKDPEIDKSLAEKYLTEAKNRYMCLDKRLLFNEQTRLINKINKTIGAHVYNNFVPHYKDLATIAQIFSDNISIKEKIVLEQETLKRFEVLSEQKDGLKHIDNLVFKSFVKKFNEKYSGLLSEQKDLLTKYISSFADEGIELKVYLNEQLSNLNDKIKTALSSEHVKNDVYMVEKTKKLMDIIKEFKDKKEMSADMLENLLKIQQFVHEVEKND
jgi:hypothetical protein